MKPVHSHIDYSTAEHNCAELTSVYNIYTIRFATCYKQIIDLICNVSRENIELCFNITLEPVTLQLST